MNKMLVTVIIFLFAVAGFIYILDNCQPTKNKPSAATLTAEQQQIVSDLQTATRGDIISDPDQSLMNGQARYLLVRWNAISKENGERTFGLSPMNNFGNITLLGSWNQDQLVRANVRLIDVKSDEWEQVMRHFFSAHPDSLTQ